jgi:16S rRNA (guanine966-N2)-methyltransferase
VENPSRILYLILVMRVISGMYRGRILRTVKDLSVRPATDRVRQTIFDVLTNRLILDGAHVLDLFAGSGSLGIEALSRGAAHATFVETNREAVAFIKTNLEALACADRADVLQEDALWFLRGCKDSFDVIFADPPYAFAETATIPELVFRTGVLKPHGYLLIEHARQLTFETTPVYEAGPAKRFGRTVVTFFRHHQQP